MRAVVTGGLGFVGLALARRLETAGASVVLFDAAGAAPAGANVVLGDVRDAGAVAEVVRGADAVFHLASVVSAGGERDFDLALSVNLDGGRTVLEACRARGGGVRLVLASTLAAFGGEAMPETVADATKLTPQTTYGATKAVCELLVNDYTRKGFLDGRTARLPTVVVRPGPPNDAASSFASAVFREPLAGRDYVLPVGRDTRLPVIGTRTLVECLVRLAELPRDSLGDDRALNLPSISVTVAEMLEALGHAGEGRTLGRVEIRPDPSVEAIVRTWPAYATSERADRLGLPRDESLEEIVGEYVEEHLSERAT